MTNEFELLRLEDIEEKVQIHLKKGWPLRKLRDTLEMELFKRERYILELKVTSSLIRLLLKRHILFTCQIQAQNLREQIAYIDKRIANQVMPKLIEKVKKRLEENVPS